MLLLRALSREKMVWVQIPLTENSVYSPRFLSNCYRLELAGKIEIKTVWSFSMAENTLASQLDSEGKRDHLPNLLTTRTDTTFSVCPPTR